MRPSWVRGSRVVRARLVVVTPTAPLDATPYLSGQRLPQAHKPARVQDSVLACRAPGLSGSANDRIEEINLKIGFRIFLHCGSCWPWFEPGETT